MQIDKDYYKILGLSPKADASQIKDAFRKLALRYHPDRNKEPGAEEHFRDIAEAYTVLSDPSKRAQYDQKGESEYSGLSNESFFQSSKFEDIFRNMGLGQDLGFFSRFFGQDSPAEETRGLDREIAIAVPLTRVLHGGSERLRINRSETCGQCLGSGARVGSTRQNCAACQGTGKSVHSRSERQIRIQSVSTCKVCAGKGYVIPEPCPACRGFGKVETEHEITLNIPSGIEEGAMLRIRGFGHMASTAGYPPGDLLIRIFTQKQEQVQRDGADLWQDLHLPLYDLVLGVSETIQSLGGPLEINIPAGTAAETVLRLKKKGLPFFQEAGYGDLYLRIHTAIPSRISSDEKRLYEKLKALAENKL